MGESRNLVQQISSLFSVKEPMLQFSKLNGSCKAYLDKNVIKLSNWGLRKSHILHEMAHIIEYQVYSGRSELGHGKEFMGISLWLYSYYFNLDYLKLCKLAANQYGLKILHLDISTKRASSSKNNTNFSDDEF